MGVHDGHRARVRERVLREGLEHLPPHNVLEILLFFSIPRGDTNELAHRILDHFGGSFEKVTQADIAELMSIPGVGESTAFLLKMIPQIAAFYQRSRLEPDITLDSMESLRKYFLPLFYGKATEEMHLILIDAALHPREDILISRGSVNATKVDLSRIAEEALLRHATGVILAHNHPRGVAKASTHDSTVTAEVKKALDTFDILLQDHVIVTEDEVCSMRFDHVGPFAFL